MFARIQFARIRLERCTQVVGACILACVFMVTSSAQTAPPHHLAIDGSKTRDLIPDFEMYALLFLTATAPSTGRAADRAASSRGIHPWPATEGFRKVYLRRSCQTLSQKS